MTEPSNAEILRAIGDLEGTVRAIGAKLDDHRDRMNAHGKRIDAWMTEQAKLATKVKLYGTGAGALAAGAVTLVVAAVKYLIGVK